MPSLDVPSMAKPVSQAARAVRTGVARQAGQVRRGAADLGGSAVRAATAATPSSLLSSDKRRKVTLDTAASAVRAGRKAKGEPAKVAAQHQVALAALKKAAADLPGDPELTKLADELMAATAAALRRGRSEPSPNGHQKNPALQPLQVVFDATRDMGHEHRAAQSKDAHVDAFNEAGKAGELDKLRGRNFEDRKKADVTSLDNPKTPELKQLYGGSKTYRGALEYWLAYRGEKGMAPEVAAKKAKESLDDLKALAKDLDGPRDAAYNAVIREIGNKHAKKHGLHDGELAAIRSYTDDDYLSINPARAQIKGWGMEQKHASAIIHKDPASLNAKDRVTQQGKVLHHERNRLEADEAFGDWFKAKHNKEFKRFDPTKADASAPGALPAEQAKLTPEELALQRLRETDLNSQRGQAAMASEIALRGLSKLPRWTGKAWRRDKMDHQRLAQYFKIVEKGDGTEPSPIVDIEITNPRVLMPHLVSASKGKESFVTGNIHLVAYEIEVTDAKDVNALSVNTHEMEVILPPDTVLEITAIKSVRTHRRDKGPEPTVDLEVTAKQVGGRFPQPPRTGRR